MSPKVIVVVVRKDGTTSVSRHESEVEAEGALVVVRMLPDVAHIYAARVYMEENRV